MRVLTVGNMYPPHHLGGYELMWRSSVEHLRSLGHEVRVLTSDYRRREPDDAIPEDPEVDRRLRWYWRDHAWPRLRFGDRLRLERWNLGLLDHHFRQFRPDVVAWWAMGGMSRSPIATVSRRGRPAVGVVVDDWLLYGPKEDQWQRAMRRLGRLRRLAEGATGVPASLRFDDSVAWIAVSEAIRRRARGGGWRLADSEIAHGGVDHDLFRPAPEQPWRGRLAYVGRIDPRKGLRTAILALARLPGMALTITGSGDAVHLAELEALVREHDLDDRVSFERRPRSELSAAYASADAVLFPVLWDEPWGLVPLEAMAVGVPVVATGTGGSGEYLVGGENCLIFEPGEDPAALAEAIARLRDEPPLRARLRTGGLATAAGFREESFNLAVAAALERVAA